MLQQALQFLQDHNEIAFATCEGNLPKIRMFQIMKQEGNVLYFSTSTEKAVWKELMQNPNVEVLVYADNVSVRCSGMVNFDVVDDVKRWIYEHNPVLPRLYSSYDQLVYFCLPIAELDYFDTLPHMQLNHFATTKTLAEVGYYFQNPYIPHFGYQPDDFG